MSYKDKFNKITIVKDETNGAVKLSLIERFESDRKVKISNNFVSQVETLDAIVLKQVIQLLNNKLPAHQPTEKILGLASSGIPMATALALHRESKFIFSTSGKFGNYENVFCFSEAHRNDKKHYFYGLEPTDEVIIIEDEVSSGLGLSNLIKALQDYGVNILAVCTVVEVLNFEAREKLKQECNIDLLSLIEVKLS
jgi:adenine phosphoribosyltransferase